MKEPVITPGTPDEILLALQELLQPQHEPPDRRSLRVAANLVQTLRREWAGGPDASARELARLQQLLGDAGQDIDTLRIELCRRIAAASVEPDLDALTDHLWKTTIDRLAIDQPGYRFGA